MPGQVETIHCEQSYYHGSHYWTPQGGERVYCTGLAVQDEQIGRPPAEMSDTEREVMGQVMSGVMSGSGSIPEDGIPVGWVADPAANTPEAKHQAQVLDLHNWWTNLAETEADAVVAKAVEYGANSIIDVGHQVARLGHRTVTDEEAAELGCMFYIVGKMGRWTDAVQRGDRVSDDTLADVGVYVRMVQRIREVGGWPFGPKGEQA